VLQACILSTITACPHAMCGVQTVMRYRQQLLPDEGTVLSLVATRDGCLIAGTASGSVVLLSPDMRRTVTRRPNLAVCLHDESC
jgi:hypothetical protein